jgi:diguanylate cyclase (GGDEF)-like protein
VSGRAYFRGALSDVGQGLHLGDALQDGATRTWSIPLYRRLQAPVSGLAMGIATVELDKLVELHEELRIKPRGTITLVRADGVVLSRTPYQESLIGLDVSGLPAFRSEVASKAAGVFQAEGTRSDGVRRLTAFRRLGNYPVLVLVSQPVTDVMAVFEWRLGWALTVLAVLTMTVFGFTFALHRSLLSLQDARRDMQRLATSDSLTGVMNRRAFTDAADREFTRARRYSRPCAVLMLDLDHFKRVNDTHGHAAGDAVLRECAAAWGALLRDQDLLGRLGGEEFCALLPETGSERGIKAAGRMRAAIESLQFRGENGPFTVTVSVGLTEVLPGDDQFDQVLERADRALYIAKQNGRNRVERVESLKAARPVLDPATGGQK